MDKENIMFVLVALNGFGLGLATAALLLLLGEVK